MIAHSLALEFRILVLATILMIMQPKYKIVLFIVVVASVHISNRYQTYISTIMFSSRLENSWYMLKKL